MLRPLILLLFLTVLTTPALAREEGPARLVLPAGTTFINYAASRVEQYLTLRVDACTLAIYSSRLEAAPFDPKRWRLHTLIRERADCPRRPAPAPPTFE